MEKQGKAGSPRLQDLPKVTLPVAVGLQPEPSWPWGPAHLHQLQLPMVSITRRWVHRLQERDAHLVALERQVGG